MKKNEYKANGKDAAAPDLRRYITLLLTNIRVICGIVIVSSVTAFILSYALPKQYRAESTVSIEQNIVSDLVKGIAVTPSAESKMRLLHVYLLSRNILEKVAAALDMDLDATTHAQKEALIQSLRGRILITHDVNRGLFTISFSDRSPVLARDFVNTMTRLYIEESTAEKRKESYDATAFLNEQIGVFQKRIEDAQVAIDAFKSQKGMYLGMNEQLLRQQITTLEQRLEELRIRKNEWTAKLNLLSDKSILIEQLRTKELALQSARANYTERHPAVRRLVLDIQGLRDLIAKTGDGADEPVFSPEYQKAKVELHSIAEMEANLNATLTGNIKDLEELPAIRTQLAELEQRKANEMRIYEQLVARFGQSEVSKQMELQDKAISFRVIDAAVTPTIHISPRRYLFMIGGVMFGFALAGAFVLGNDILRGKIRSVYDLHSHSLPVLVKLPNTAPPEGVARKKRHTAILTGLTACLIVFICAAAVIEFMNLPHIEKAIAVSKRLLF